ncbi:DUF1254 domain-containing protein [Kribbella sp. NPDC049174]|uniref:DUF1254 domain-containing protein n=1 Tax=Kribbella sp. NPDC049174 TaxID=3364112 RepID=UPI0037198F2B
MDGELAEIIGIEGYTYLYPLVLMDLTRLQVTNTEKVSYAPLRVPPDTFLNVPAFPPADFRVVVRPNFDTLYSTAFLDLREEPRIVSVPPAEGNYYLLPFYDMFGEVFACPGTRTTGDEAGNFAIVGPGWSGDLPAGVRRYDAPTSWVWIIGRTEASVATYDKVHAFQSQLKITPLSAWGSEPLEVVGTVDPSVDNTTEPLRQVFAMDATTFFRYASELLQQHAPHIQDYPVLDRLARIGFNVGDTFDLNQADPVVQGALAKAVPAAQQKITDRQKRLGRTVNGWEMTTENVGNYGTDYLQRACVELIGLGANLPDDAIYPLAYVDVEGQPFTGEQRYAWHLAKQELPPVNAFWSLTLYDAEGFQVANDLNRFAIGDRDDLLFNDDGSLDIHIQHNRPDSGTSNWLPAPEGGFNLCARLYYPKPEVLDGTWTPPPVTKV